MLPSQTARPNSSRSHMYRRKRSKRVPLVLALLVILIGVAVVFKRMGGTTQPPAVEAAPAVSSPPAVSSNVLSKPAATSSAPTKLVKNETSPPSSTPDIIMGGGRPNTASSSSNSQTPPTSKNTSNASTSNSAPAQQRPAQSTPKITPPIPPLGTGTFNPVANPITTKPDSTATQTPREPAKSTGGASTPAASPPPPSTPARDQTGSESNQRAVQRIQTGLDLLRSNKPIEARKLLTDALRSPGLSAADAERVRAELTKLNQRLVFSPEIVAGDPFASSYIVQSGDALARLPRKLDAQIDWRFVQRVNQISSPERIQTGQRLKIITGPFHAIVDKAAFRLDLYLGESENQVYVRSFRVGLGEHDATPEGAYVVKANSKLIDGDWVNPRTGEKFLGKDPRNPIGRHWIGLIGVSDNIRDLEGYGIHGTIEPDSIGRQRSMGCVRMLADDVALVYELLMENISRVEVHGQEFP